MKILANGEIVADDDPRVQRRGAEGHSRGTNQPSGHQQRIINTTHNNNEPVAHGPTTSIFDTVDQRLSSVGMPTWNLGPYPVSPVVSAGFLLSFIMMGFRGLMFSGLLFCVVNYSRSGDRNRPSNHRTAVGNVNQMGSLNNSQNNQGTSGNRNQANPKTKYFTGAGHKLS